MENDPEITSAAVNHTSEANEKGEELSAAVIGRQQQQQHTAIETDITDANGNKHPQESSTQTSQTQDCDEPKVEAATQVQNGFEQSAGSTATASDCVMENSRVSGTQAASVSDGTLNVTDKFGTVTDTYAAEVAARLDEEKNDSDAELKGHFIVPTPTLANMGSTSGSGPMHMRSRPHSSEITCNRPMMESSKEQMFGMSEEIIVRVEMPDGKIKLIKVDIDRSRQQRNQYLGGFKHRETGVKFLTASAQTNRELRPNTGKVKYSRDTQTYTTKQKQQQTTCSTSTQMTKAGVYVTDEEDKVITAGPYFRGDEYLALILEKVIIIQKYFRRMTARRKVEGMRRDRDFSVEWDKGETRRKEQEKQERLQQEYERRVHPGKKSDFDLIFSALESWRRDKEEKISAIRSGAERKAALCRLLEEETQLLSTVEQYKQLADETNRAKMIESFIEKTASPKRWQSADGRFTSMDTPLTLRARELRDIYTSISMPNLTQDERLDVLLTLKHTVKEHDCKLTREIIDLVDREANLIMRRTKEENLLGLRKRIATLFLQYFKNPDFNPGVVKTLKVPQDASALQADVHQCRGCGRHLREADYELSANTRVMGRCRDCQRLDNNARRRDDHSLYQTLLRALRRVERSCDSESKIAFLLQVRRGRYS
ncbi:PREDICTED: IQ and ubiquitin-like domain-containing protein isoform X2 [Priapulus caudatus]|nr:PREDICTED: IQ and ubiquitin-like domain-containing protein isoform X2 [Priapulus caudatus]